MKIQRNRHGFGEIGSLDKKLSFYRHLCEIMVALWPLG
jgi:hypothetical protein